MEGRFLLGAAIVLFALLCVLPILLGRRGRLDPFDARHAFLFFFALYTLPYPLLTYLRQMTPLLPVFSDGLVLRGMVLSIAGLLAFYAGYALRVGDQVASALPALPRGLPRRALHAALAVFLLGAVLFGVFIITIGGPAAYLQAGYLGRYRLEGGREHFAIGLPLLVTGLLLLYHAAYEARSSVAGALAWILIIALGFLLLAIGRRRYLLTLILAIAAYRHYRHRQFSVGLLLVLGGAGFILFNAWGLLRQFPWHGFASRAPWEAVLQRPLRDFIYTVAGAGEFSGAGVWLPQVISRVSSGSLSYLFGLSYLRAPIAFIPRILFPGRPPMLGEWYVTTFHPELSEQGGGMGFFFLAEAYLNFGVPGIIAVMGLAGVILRCAAGYLRRHRDIPATALLYAAFISWIPSGLRVDFATAVKGFLEFYFAVILLAVLYSRGWRAPTGRVVAVKGEQPPG